MKWIAVVAVVGGLGIGASGAAGAGATSCTSGFTEARTASQLSVSGTSCATGRKVAERAVGIVPRGCVKVLDRKGHIGFRRPCVQLSYKCTAVSTNQRRALKVTCKRGARTIRFHY